MVKLCKKKKCVNTNDNESRQVFQEQVGNRFPVFGDDDHSGDDDQGYGGVDVQEKG